MEERPGRRQDDPEPETVEALLVGFGTVAKTVEALLVEFESVASRAAEVARAAPRIIAEGPEDEDAGSVYIVALEATARELEATASRPLSVRTAGHRTENTSADRERRPYRPGRRRTRTAALTRSTSASARSTLRNTRAAVLRARTAFAPAPL